MIAAFDGLYRWWYFWDQSSQLTWFDLATHLPLLDIQTSYLWFHLSTQFLVSLLQWLDLLEQGLHPSLILFLFYFHFCLPSLKSLDGIGWLWRRRSVGHLSSGGFCVFLPIDNVKCWCTVQMEVVVQLSRARWNDQLSFFV